MACMGPSKEFADQQAEEAFEKIMALLKEEYQIDRWSFPEPQEGAEWLQLFMYHSSVRNAKEWDEHAEALKKAIVDLIWHQHCMDF